MDEDIQGAVYSILKDLRSLEPLKELFWQHLNYDRVNQPLPRQNWPKGADQALAENPILFAEANDFHILYCRLASDRLRLTDERAVVNHLLQGHPYTLFVFSDDSQANWHFVNVKEGAKTIAGRKPRRMFRRIAVGPEERLRTATERISMLDIAEIAPILFRVSRLQIQQCHDEAFDVEAVTKEFYGDYKRVFASVQNILYHQTDDLAWAHDYALQLLNRLMFLYFVQRKRWLGDDPEFLRNFWEAYKGAGRSQDTFFEEWLSVLFFEAFNERFQAGRSDRQHLPPEIRRALALAPYLNGGLFTRIFYTPRIEIDLMCRLSLVDWLANQLGENHKSLLYETVFAYDPEEKEDADADVARANLWPELNRLLHEVTVLDPACGSGSFLVGMLAVLDDLLARADVRLGTEETAYERRKHIIGRSLYGVDVMKWAVHVAELRLWLQLMAETELKPSELKFRPLLPTLSFKVRPGDSLVQEIGGVNFGLHRGHLDIPTSLKGRLTQLKGEKLKFYNNDPSRRFHSEPELKYEERRLFHEILAARHHTLGNRIKEIRRQLSVTQMNLAGEETRAVDLKSAQVLETEAATLEVETEQAVKALDAQRAAQEVPFVWDIAFVEIFEGDKGGFDVVMGNPPYVRQERIAPPLLREQDFDPDDWRKLKRAHKERLQRSVAVAYPRFFDFKPASDRYRKLDSKSDLYVYFYLHGLSLLNEKGTFCFITSNSWLDVGYGKDLQEFLLKHSHVKMILDNEAKRSFSQADVNTIIALLAKPDDARASGMDKMACFVMFKVPFEDVLSPIVFEEIEEATERVSRPEFRVVAKSQRDLYEEGMGQGGAPGTPARYRGNKWGGKYLRAPEIFFTILEKGKGKLVRLGDIAEVLTVSWSRQGQNSRIMSSKSVEISGVQVADVLKSPKDVTRIRLRPADTRYLLRLEKWVKKQLVYAPILWVDLRGDKHICHRCLESIAFTHNFHGIIPFDEHSIDLLCATLNSTAWGLLIEVLGRRGLGGGAVRVLVEDLRFQFPALLLSAFTLAQRERILTIFEEMAQREMHSIFGEVGLPKPNRDLSNIDPSDVSLDKVLADRRALDEVVFEVLGLTEAEQLEVYRAVVELVKNRFVKAGSV